MLISTLKFLKYRVYDHEYLQKKLTTQIFSWEKHHLRPYKVSRKTILRVKKTIQMRNYVKNAPHLLSHG